MGWLSHGRGMRTARPGRGPVLSEAGADLRSRQLLPGLEGPEENDASWWFYMHEKDEDPGV